MERVLVIVALLIIIATEVAISVIRKHTKKHTWSNEIFPFLKTSIRIIGLFVFIGVLLSAFGIKSSKVFLGAGGIIGIVVGFGFKDFIGNFAAGIWIMLVDPFNPGDTIQVKNTRGKVIYVTALTTVLESTEDGNDERKVVYIPNKNLWNSAVTVIASEKENKSHNNG